MSPLVWKLVDAHIEPENPSGYTVFGGEYDVTLTGTGPTQIDAIRAALNSYPANLWRCSRRPQMYGPSAPYLAGAEAPLALDQKQVSCLTVSPGPGKRWAVQLALVDWGQLDDDSLWLD